MSPIGQSPTTLALEEGKVRARRNSAGAPVPALDEESESLPTAPAPLPTTLPDQVVFSLTQFGASGASAEEIFIDLELRFGHRCADLESLVSTLTELSTSRPDETPPSLTQEEELATARACPLLRSARILDDGTVQVAYIARDALEVGAVIELTDPQFALRTGVTHNNERVPLSVPDPNALGPQDYPDAQDAILDDLESITSLSSSLTNGWFPSDKTRVHVNQRRVPGGRTLSSASAGGSGGVGVEDLAPTVTASTVTQDDLALVQHLYLPRFRVLLCTQKAPGGMLGLRPFTLFRIVWSAPSSAIGVSQNRQPIASRGTRAASVESEYSLATVRTASTRAEVDILRRFSDFEWLHRELIAMHGKDWLVPPLPQKRFLGRFSPEFLDARMRALERFLEYVCTHPVPAPGASASRLLASIIGDC